MASTRPCPFCAEEILEDAVLCRYCRSRLGGTDPRRWYRNHPARRIAGVTAGVSRALALPLPVVRAAFLIGLVLQGATVLVYVGLWLVMPFADGGVPPYRRAMAWGAKQILRLFGGKGSSSGTPPPTSLDVPS
jgi:phage shock protein PspC (stress-responsive transcriptional regulator)